MQRVVFLDRDGTMNEEVHYLYRPEDLVLLSGCAEAVRLLNEAGYRVIVVTNQAGVARGYYTEADVDALHVYMNTLLAGENAHVDAFYYCPHHPEHGMGKYKKKCRCRKPETGMFEQAEKDLPDGIDRNASFMIGDKLLDTEAGKRFGVTSILVGTGYGAKLREQELLKRAGGDRDQTDFGSSAYDYYAETLLDAVHGIINGSIAPAGAGREQ